jgi:hypothetical protein
VTVNTGTRLKILREWLDLLNNHDPALWMIDLDAFFTSAYLLGLTEGQRVAAVQREADETAYWEAKYPKEAGR